jgi:hypothetical protein
MHVVSFIYKKIIPIMPFRVIQKFQSPSDNGGVLDGGGKNSISPPMITMATKKIQLP